MADSDIKLESASIVFLGSFNPKIFHPVWFASENMVSKQEAESAEISVIHPELSSFSMSKIQYEVTRNRFVIQTTYTPSFAVMKDLVLGTFGLLQYTPVHSMGLNHEFHFLLDSEETWHRLGHKVAPKEVWTDILEKPGTRKLIMEGVRTDQRKGYVRIEIAPSIQVHPGVFIAVNDHFQVAEPESNAGCQDMLGVLNKEWDLFLDSSKLSALRLLERK